MSDAVSEPTNEPAAPASTEPAAKSEPLQLPDDHPLVTAYNAQKEKIRALQATNQANAEAAEKLREIEEANKSEAQKRAEELERLRQENESYKTREQVAAWKAEVADAAEDLGDDQKARLRAALAGNTREEIEAHAEILKPLFVGQSAEQPKPGVVSTIGREPGAAPNIPIGEQIAHAEATRDKATPGSEEWKAAQARVMDLKGLLLFEASKVT